MESVQRPDKMVKALALLSANLLNSVAAVHLCHLSVRGSGAYAAHMAMGCYYEGLPGLVDSLAEQFQGLSGTPLDFPETTLRPLRTTDECYVHLNNVYSQVDRVSKVCQHSELIAVLDDIKSLVNSTKYKLQFLQ